jgi:hypothetical protein
MEEQPSVINPPDEPEGEKSGQKEIPCRIDGLIARDAPRAVLLRRGPTKWVQLILWHTDSDTFEAGQWFRGRIYESHSDLSPDGTLFLYLARKDKTPARQRSSYTWKWTAISHPPYFTALALWPVGEEWDGGGSFLDNRSIWLCHQSARAHPNHRKLPRGLKVQATFEPPRFVERALRNGWEQAQPGRFSWAKDPTRILSLRSVTEQPAIWRKPSPDGRFYLIREWYRDPDFSWAKLTCLLDSETNQQLPLDQTTWEEWDQQGRLVFAREGKLWSGEISNGQITPRLIADFNASKPTSVLPPAWAKRW